MLHRLVCDVSTCEMHHNKYPSVTVRDAQDTNEKKQKQVLWRKHLFPLIGIWEETTNFV